MKKTTKAEALRTFKKMAKQVDSTDKAALREAWNIYTDSLHKDGIITAKQYDTWDNPF